MAKCPTTPIYGLHEFTISRIYKFQSKHMVEIFGWRKCPATAFYSFLLSPQIGRIRLPENCRNDNYQNCRCKFRCRVAKIKAKNGVGNQLCSRQGSVRKKVHSLDADPDYGYG